MSDTIIKFTVLALSVRVTKVYINVLPHLASKLWQRNMLLSILRHVMTRLLYDLRCGTKFTFSNCGEICLFNI